MADDPEARTQIARLLAEERLRTASLDDIRKAIDESIERLAEGIVQEAGASDDVTDSESAMSFVTARLDFLAPIINYDQQQRLRAAIEERVRSW